MTSVLQAVNKYHPIVPVEGDVGVEIEVEGYNLPTLNKLWKNERDGSLQGESMEYVLRKPSTLDELSIALRFMETQFKAAGTQISDAVRAGVHVHINCQKLSLTKLYTFFTLYLIFENVLVKFCGQRREGNLFCLRVKDAEYLVSALIKAANNKRRMIRDLHTDQLRYAAMNVKALGDYGSVEFRTMRSDGNLQVIYTWAEILLGMRKYVESSLENPEEVIGKFSDLGPLEFFHQVFGDNAKTLSDKYTTEDDLLKDLYSGVRYSQDIAYCVDDWKVFDNTTKLISGVEVDIENDNEPIEDF